MSTKFSNPYVARKFKSYPPPIRKKLMNLRQIILNVAAKTEGVGRLEEALKWGEPSFLTTESGSGSMIRIDAKGPDYNEYGIYFLCQTDLVAQFKKLFPKKFRFSGNRAILFSKSENPPTKELRHCIALALTYKL